MRNNKITIVGAGNVGATTAHIAAGRKLGEIVLIDIVEGLAEGKALDMAEAGPVQGYSGKITGATDWEKAKDMGRRLNHKKLSTATIGFEVLIRQDRYF